MIIDMKIAFLIPELKLGGAERTVSVLSKELSKNHDVHVILFNKRTELDYGGILHLLGDRINRITNIPRLYVAYYKLLKRLQPDIVCSLLTRANTLNSVIKYHNTRRLIWIQNYPIYQFFKHPLFSVQEKLKWLTIHRTVDKILFPSLQLAYDFNRLYRLPYKKSEVIYNPINLNMINDQGSEKLDHWEESMFGDPTIINVGRLTWQKGQWHLIRFFKKVVSEVRSAKLIIVGGGQLYYFLKTLVERLDLTGKVTLYGPTKNPYKLMKKADIFCFPSLREGMGIALAEALACGLASVASDCLVGPREILSPTMPIRLEPVKSPTFSEYGILMPVLDGILYGPNKRLTQTESVWADLLITLAQDDSLRRHYSMRGPERARDFDVHRIAHEFVHLTKSIFTD